LDNSDFEDFLTTLTTTLTKEAEAKRFQKPIEFESRIRELIIERGGWDGHAVDIEPHPQIFPDIPLGKNGIEVKFSEKDTWRIVANNRKAKQ